MSSEADQDYKRSGDSGDASVPIVRDSDNVPNDLDKNPDSDEALAKDDLDVDESNIIEGGKTRGAKPTGSYKEPGDDEGLPGPDDGTSAIRTGKTS